MILATNQTRTLLIIGFLSVKYYSTLHEESIECSFNICVPIADC